MGKQRTLVLGATGTAGRRVAARLGEAVLSGEVAPPLGGLTRAFNDAGAIAAVAAAALTEPGHTGGTYELSGPEALSFDEAAAIISEATGRPVRCLGSADDYLRVMTGQGDGDG